MKINYLEELFKLEDLEYKEFNMNLVPNYQKKSIGVRVPLINNLAKKMIKENDYKEFISNLNHEYFEEDMLHMKIITNLNDYDEAIYELNRFIDYVDNWAVCDSRLPKCFNKHKNEILNYTNSWIKSNNVYRVRKGIDIYMSLFLDESFKEEYLYTVAEIKSDEYYINMMQAWYYATALAKQYDFSIKIIENKLLDKWVHNKAIQKSIESYRVTDEHKEYLKTLKIK